MNEAEKLADSMDDEIAQAGRVSNHNGMLAAALLRGQAEQIKVLREALSKAGLFLHHCWCDVQMNDYSFERLNEQMKMVDDALAATKEAE